MHDQINTTLHRHTWDQQQRKLLALRREAINYAITQLTHTHP